jgi:hypothetical protein
MRTKVQFILFAMIVYLLVHGYNHPYWGTNQTDEAIQNYSMHGYGW